jgi:acetyl-CoA C-acetyltransferase
MSAAAAHRRTLKSRIKRRRAGVDMLACSQAAVMISGVSETKWGFQIDAQAESVAVRVTVKPEQEGNCVRGGVGAFQKRDGLGALLAAVEPPATRPAPGRRAGAGPGSVSLAQAHRARSPPCRPPGDGPTDPAHRRHAACSIQPSPTHIRSWPGAAARLSLGNMPPARLLLSPSPFAHCARRDDDGDASEVCTAAGIASHGACNAAAATGAGPAALQLLVGAAKGGPGSLHSECRTNTHGKGTLALSLERVATAHHARADPFSQFNGSFLTVSAPQLGAYAIKAAVEKSSVPVDKISDVYMGNVLQGGIGQAPARQAAILAGLPTTVEAITINKVCASGLKAVVFAAQNIQLGLAEAQVAGGFESMSRVPYYLPRASSQPAFGHQQLEDGLIKDGLWDVYNQFHMGNCAENTAKKHNITREDQDAFAISSYQRAQAAWARNAFADEIVPVTVKGRKGDTVITKDEGYDSLNVSKLPTLKPAFVKDGTGTVTAANASTLNDGASALVLTNRDLAQQYGSKSRVLARIVASADAAADPIDFPTAPAKAVPIALERAGITQDQVAVWEFNEAFAVAIKACQKILGLDPEKVNPLGGAISLGHALGSSGSRILTTLLHQLKVGEYGVAAICNGGGAATAVVVQRIEEVE